MAIRHFAEQGDCVLRIASRYGFGDPKTIYEHPDNAELRKKRPNLNALVRGDQITIPDKQPKAVSASTGRTHQFSVTVLRTMLRLVIKNEMEEPVADKKWELKLGDVRYEGVTSGGDDPGILEQLVPDSDAPGELTVWLTENKKGPHYFWNVRIGHLQEIAGQVESSDRIRGVQQRLNNLGFYCGDADGLMDDVLRYALRGFQNAAKIDTTGKIDDLTLTKLLEMHGGI